MESQRERVQAHLKANGSVSRNWALERHITRLGAIMCDIRKSGIDYTGAFVKTEHGQDYVYTLKRSEPNFKPYKPYQTDSQKERKELGDKLGEILRENKWGWDNQAEYLRIKNAKKGRNLDIKKSIIKEYGKDGNSRV